MICFKKVLVCAGTPFNAGIITFCIPTFANADLIFESSRTLNLVIRQFSPFSAPVGNCGAQWRRPPTAIFQSARDASSR